ncbi:MAG: hypothetical protein AAF215_01695 [Cyanobacteria bacterium P01_A01_bin.123]
MAETRAHGRQSWFFELIWVGVALLIATLLVNSRMIRDGLNGIADLQWHIAWLQYFFKGLTDGDVYPRWLGGTNYGYGSPTFVFYPPLVYYLGSALKGLGLNTERTITLLFSLGILGAGGMMYGYQRSRWGAGAALVSAVAYLSAPYVVYVVYSFGSLSTVFAMVWIPWIWWATDQSRNSPHWRLGVSLGWMLLSLTHLPSLLLGLVVWLPYTLVSYRKAGWQAIAAIGFATLVGLGLASVFLLPATLEKGWVNIDAMATVGGATFYDRMIRLHHLVTTRLNFDSHLTWAYFYQVLSSSAIAVFALVAYRRQRLVQTETLKWLGFTLILALSMTSLTWSLWRLSPTLVRVQSPTRLLSFLSMGGAALISPAMMAGNQSRHWGIRLSGWLLITVLIMGNLAYAYQWPRRFPTLHNSGRADTAYLDGIREALWNPYQDNLPDVPEYQPLIDHQPAPQPQPGEPPVSVLTGDATVNLQTWKNQYRVLGVRAATATTLKVRTFYYPAWQITVDDRPQSGVVLSDGAIAVELPPGAHTVVLRYQPTRALIWGAGLSLVSLGIGLGMLKRWGLLWYGEARDARRTIP